MEFTGSTEGRPGSCPEASCKKQLSSHFSQLWYCLSPLSDACGLQFSQSVVMHKGFYFIFHWPGRQFCGAHDATQLGYNNPSREYFLRCFIGPLNPGKKQRNLLVSKSLVNLLLLVRTSQNDISVTSILLNKSL